MTEDQSINYFLEGSGNVVKNAELLQHLEYLEMRADNGGFTCLEFTKLSSVLVERHMPAQISRRFVNCLVPNQPVQGKFLVDLILWALGDFVDISKYVASSFLQIVNLCLENDLVKGRAPLSHVYELLLSRLENQSNSNTILAILVKITKKVDVDDRRVKFFRKISKNIGLGNNVSALLWRFRQLRPDLEPSCPPTVGKSTANTILHKRFRRISDAGVEKVLSGLGWEPGQLATKVIFKDRLKQTLLPSAETLNLEGGLQSKRNSKIPLQCIESTEDLENVELPINILSVLGCKAACNILPRKELIERFCIVLYHALSKEFSSLPTPRSKSERERRDKRQRRFLRILMEFQIHCFQGIPVVGRFLHEFLIDWDGEQFFDEILGLIKVCQITEFKEIYDTILSQVEQHFHVYTLIDKLLVLDAYFELLKFWSAVEYKRLIEMKDGLFLDSSTNCENPLSSIIDLSAHIGELVETALASARSEHSPDQSLFSHFITEKYIVAQEVMLRFEVAVRLILPQPFYHEALFSFSYLSISQVAKYVLTQKKRVIPLLKERGAYLETMGDSKSAKIIRNQLSLDQLIRGFDSSIADMLLVLSPTSVYQRSDSLLRMGWTVDEDYILDRLFISKHPAFLSLTIKYFSELGLNKSEVQDIWKGLTVDRIVCENSDDCFYSEFNQSKAPNTFYKSKASNMVAVSNPHLDHFLNYITENVPVVGEFIQVFCQPSKFATSVITTTTMDSGISSYQTSKAKKNHVLKSKRTDENRRSSPRVTVARNNEKRKSDTTPNDLSKRTVLTELN